MITNTSNTISLKIRQFYAKFLYIKTYSIYLVRKRLICYDFIQQHMERLYMFIE